MLLLYFSSFLDLKVEENLLEKAEDIYHCRKCKEGDGFLGPFHHYPKMGNYFFKPPCKLVDVSILKQAIANQVNDSLLYQTCMDVNTEELEHFERILTIARGQCGSYLWESLASESAGADFEKTLCEIMKELFISDFNVGRLFALYTLVVDVVAFKLKKRDQINVDRLLNVMHHFLKEEMFLKTVKYLT